jgi:hypothetical protein
MRSRLAAALALAVAPLAACGDAADAERTLKTAEATLAALHSTPGAAPPEFVVETHASIRRDLATVLSGDAEAQRAAAQLIVGQTHAGDAELAALEAERLESQAADLLARAETLAGRLYRWRHARAEAAASFRPDDVLSEIADQIAEAQAERRELLEEQSRLDERIAELETAAEAAAQEASEHRAREANLRDEALTQEAQARAQTIERVYEAQRKADDATARESDLRARIDQLRPERREIGLQITGVERRVELLRESRQSLEDRQARTARTAQVDREQASVAARDLENVLSELHEFRRGQLAEAYERAESSFASAQTSLRSAATAGASSTYLGAAQLGRAQLAAARAVVSQRYARTLEELASLEPRLPFAGELESRAKAARELAERQIEAASEAYSSAASTYRRAASGRGAERLRALADQLEARAENPLEAASAQAQQAAEDEPVAPEN